MQWVLKNLGWDLTVHGSRNSTFSSRVLWWPDLFFCLCSEQGKKKQNNQLNGNQTNKQKLQTNQKNQHYKNKCDAMLCISSLAGTHAYCFLDPCAQLLTLKKCYVEIPKVSFLWLSLKFLVFWDWKQFDAALNLAEYCVHVMGSDVTKFLSLHWMFLSWTFKFDVWYERIVPYLVLYGYQMHVGFSWNCGYESLWKKTRPTIPFLFRGVALVLILQFLLSFALNVLNGAHIDG